MSFLLKSIHMHLHIKCLQTSRDLRLPWSQLMDSPVRNSDLIRELRPREVRGLCLQSCQYLAEKAELQPRCPIAQSPVPPAFSPCAPVEPASCPKSLQGESIGCDASADAVLAPGLWGHRDGAADPEHKMPMPHLKQHLTKSVPGPS